MKFKKVILCIFAVLLIFTFTGSSFKMSNNQEVRNVKYDDEALDVDSLLVEFDDYDIIESDNGNSIVATKTFDASFFSNLDFVDLDNNEEEITVNYDAIYDNEESTVYLSVTIVNENGSEPIIETLPGLITFNKLGESDIMFLDGEEEIWLSDLEHSLIIDNTGFWSFVKKVLNFVSESKVTRNIVNNIAAICSPFIRLGTTILYLNGYGSFAAWVGAQVLNMSQEYKVTKYNNGTEVSVPTGIYHANFNCWQKNVGYDDFYDEVFDNGTQIAGRKRMQRHKYEIDIDGDSESDYIFWAWKGDYYNLGAGCEIGIYKKVNTSNFGLRWTIDTSKAFSCDLNLKYNGKEIINWNNNGNKHWWFTGFNSNFQYPILLNINNLKATFSVTFNCFNSQSLNNMYNNFLENWNLYKYDLNKDWKYWTTNQNSYKYYSGMNCHTATLSF